MFVNIFLQIMIPSVQRTGMAVIRGPQFCLNCFTTALFPIRLCPEVGEILLSYKHDTKINFTIKRME